MIRRLPGGSYELVRTGRRDILMKALPGGVIRVYAPGWASMKTIDAAVLARWQELCELSRRLDARRSEADASHPVSDGTPLTISGTAFILRRKPSQTVRAAVHGNEIVLSSPDGTPDDLLRGALKACLSRLALQKIRCRLEYYSPLVGRPYGRVAVRDQHTRWGSCSSKGNLNFNWKLILAPPEALDYVVVHELCHLAEFSHSPKFWQLVRSILPEYEFWKKWLKDHGSELGV